MSKQSKIRWKDEDKLELQRVIKNFNAKINRVTKKSPHLVNALPSKIKLKDTLTSIETRADLNRKLNEIKRFSRKGVEEVVVSPTGLALTKYEIKETKLKVRIVNQKRAKKIKELGLSVEKGNVGQVEYQNLQPKKFTTNKTEMEWDKFVKSAEREIQSRFDITLMEIYQNNYIKGLSDNFNGDTSELQKKLNKIDPKTFFELAMSDPRTNIKSQYDEVDNDLLLEVINETWDSLIG